MSLTSRCQVCGAEARLQANFCHQCGSHLGVTRDGDDAEFHRGDNPSAPRVSGVDSTEKRQMTVLFCDLVDSTGLQESLGEQYWEVLSAYRAVCKIVVDRFEGEVAEYVGDGVVVYFGVPVAHEDDAQRAVRAGLGILDAVRRLSPRVQRDHGVDLEVRITGDTGSVVARSPGDGRPPTAYGRALILASRLKAVARPQSLVITDATHRLVRGYFQTHDLGSRDLVTVGKVEAVYEVLRELSLIHI